MNAAGAEQQRLAPGLAEHRDIGGKGDHGRRHAIDILKPHRRNAQNFVQLRAIPDGARERLPDRRGIAHQPHQNFRFGRVGNYVRRAAARNRSDVHRARPEQRVLRQRNAANRFERVEQRVDCRFAQLGIGRMRHFAARDNLKAQSALRRKRQFILGGLAVHEISRAAGRTRGDGRSGAVALLADDEQQAEIPDAFAEQLFRRANHRRDDALGVARAAPTDEFRDPRSRRKTAARCPCASRA